MGGSTCEIREVSLQYEERWSPQRNAQGISRGLRRRCDIWIRGKGFQDFPNAAKNSRLCRSGGRFLAVREGDTQGVLSVSWISSGLLDHGVLNHQVSGVTSLLSNSGRRIRIVGR